MDKSNIILIGMPSSGKTTIGQPLASELSKLFIDTDAVIKDRENKALRDIVNDDGLKRFLEIQEEVILGMNLKNYVVATGGSVIYGDASMRCLKQIGTVIYLKIAIDELEKRITTERRFARNQGQSFKDLYNERSPLYEKYADIVIDCNEKSIEEIIGEIINKL
ncbi:MAG: aroK [Clostridiales bacterium]|jgi:shikimate kinase|nr:aroK [Clostridiales bacterium]